MISCHQHDYIEIACLYRLLLRLTLKSGESFDGRALDTGSRGGREWLQLETTDGLKEVDLDRVRRITALEDQRHFETVEFGD